jgi:hypothetical protein
VFGSAHKTEACRSATQQSGADRAFWLVAGLASQLEAPDPVVGGGNAAWELPRAWICLGRFCKGSAVGSLDLVQDQQQEAWICLGREPDHGAPSLSRKPRRLELCLRLCGSLATQHSDALGQPVGGKQRVHMCTPRDSLRSLVERLSVPGAACDRLRSQLRQTLCCQVRLPLLDRRSAARCGYLCLTDSLL